MRFFEERNGSLIWRSNGETLMLTPWGQDGLRVRARLMEEIGDESAALLPAASDDTCITIEDTHAVIRSGRIVAEVSAQDGSVVFRNRDGKVLLRNARRSMHMAPPRRFQALPGGSWRLNVRFLPEEGEKIYGMGQYQQEIMDLKGCSLDLEQRNTQITIPFYISSIGYGFFWNNPAVGQAHFGHNITEWTAESTKQMDYWITAGDTPAQIEQAYAAVTGTVPMMPEYGLGFWQCKLRYYNQEQVLSVAREYKRRGIPLDVIIVDFYHWPHCGDWRFDEEFFPDPAAMVKELHDMGIETMVSIWPTVHENSENAAEMKQQGLVVRSRAGVDVQAAFEGNNVFTDTTNPRARAFMWDKVRHNYADLGIRTFWLDAAEPEYTTYEYEQYLYQAGPGPQVTNMYPREYARVFYEGQRAIGQPETVSLIRSAWAGSQRYGALVWSGDVASTYEDFRKQLCAGIHMGLAGIPWWNTDIGGFHSGNIHDPAFRELLVRWFQFGAFSPVMRLHGVRDPGEQIVDKNGVKRMGTGADNEIWSYGEENYAIFRKFIGIRELMRDYIREIMREAHEKGSPVMRALFYEFPEDAACWDIKDEYLFGPDVLVAPVCQAGAVSREVYLPAGACWTHAGTGEVYEGGRACEIAAPIDTLPVFLREGRQAYLAGRI